MTEARLDDLMILLPLNPRYERGETKCIVCDLSAEILILQVYFQVIYS